MTLEVTADTAIAARDKASTLASSVLGNLSAVCAHIHPYSSHWAFLVVTADRYKLLSRVTQPSYVPQINGIGSQNAQTSSVSVNPKYGTGSGNSNTIVGYTYSNQINVEVKNLTSALLSEVLDTAVASGSNQLQIQRVSVNISCFIHLSWHCFQVWQLVTCEGVPAQVPCAQPIYILPSH